MGDEGAAREPAVEGTTLVVEGAARKPLEGTTLVVEGAAREPAVEGGTMCPEGAGEAQQWSENIRTAYVETSVNTTGRFAFIFSSSVMSKDDGNFVNTKKTPASIYHDLDHIPISRSTLK